MHKQALQIQKSIGEAKVVIQAQLDKLERRMEILSAASWDVLDVIHGQMPMEKFIATHVEAIANA